MSAPIGVIGGTALAELAGVVEQAPPAPVDTEFGVTSGPLVRGRYSGRDVVFVMRHGPGHAIAPHAINYRANIAALAAAGCRQVIAIAAVGGITEAMSPGRIVIPHQIIDYSWGRAHSLHDDPARGTLDHIDFTDPYDEPLRQVLRQAAQARDLDPAEAAVHGITQGPRLETAAEIDRMARDGCDIVGMTGMPEASLAREAGLAYACCAVVVNKAAGRTGGLAIHAEIEATLARAMGDVEGLLTDVLPAL
ncbi:S-methyl-5'-thioinosine phosphorylase [Salinisphaera sp. Q1T1-3]|uniref:S-methyl-5'-thioinosine phosphorylase n=1 Tax=Salinisphaera sp. Q1T1-3 TaxID=2321229 RepID=UPI000E733770|nr:S-methyl-5'-thioinosine phosphorylase [Salinisphaera sp. Q1T1-3]RJS92040.1 S-methyl-5'-thioinosine phosphorylase [Salinisphaera sp. Q1T1-3]